MINSKYGPTLVKELNDAGVAGLPFTWGEEGVQFDPSITDEQKVAIQAVFDAHDPTATLPVVEADPVDKLKAFLAQNPDVAAVLQGA